MRQLKIYDYNGRKNISGERIRQLRCKRHWSQGALAKHLQLVGVVTDIPCAEHHWDTVWPLLRQYTIWSRHRASLFCWSIVCNPVLLITHHSNAVLRSLMHCTELRESLSHWLRRSHNYLIFAWTVIDAGRIYAYIIGTKYFL